MWYFLLHYPCELAWQKNIARSNGRHSSLQSLRATSHFAKKGGRGSCGNDCRSHQIYWANNLCRALKFPSLHRNRSLRLKAISAYRLPSLGRYLHNCALLCNKFSPFCLRYGRRACFALLFGNARRKMGCSCNELRYVQFAGCAEKFGDPPLLGC